MKDCEPISSSQQMNRLRKRFDSMLRIWITMGSGSPVQSIQQMLRKYRRHRLRLMRRKEYNRLRAMVPSIAANPKVSKVTVIEEAIKYIDQLHAALATRLRTRGLPQAFKGLILPQDIGQISHSQIRELVRQVLPPSSARHRHHRRPLVDDAVWLGPRATRASSDGITPTHWRMLLQRIGK